MNTHVIWPVCAKCGHVVSTGETDHPTGDHEPDEDRDPAEVREFIEEQRAKGRPVINE